MQKEYLNKFIFYLFRKAGGSVIYDRVAGVLAVSRAFGDHDLRPFGVIALPEITRLELRVIHRYVVVASDGLWDVVTPKVNISS